MHGYVIEMLECAACHGSLVWQIDEADGDRIETADATCGDCRMSYPVREGIGVFLLSDFSRDDLWAQMEGWLPKYLREHPDVERLLMESPLDTLDPADQRFRANVLEERGQLDEALAVRAEATPVYTAEQLTASEDQTEYVLRFLEASEGPVVDLASGGGALVEEIARSLDRPVIATDFSPTILRRARIRLQHLGLYDRVSLLAFDARQTPLRNSSVQTMTSNQGLPNIREPGPLLTELRRVVSGHFAAMTIFYDEEDQSNAAAIRELQVTDLLYRDRAVAAFRTAGWEVEILNSRSALARPTPRSQLLGVGIDGLPVVETTLDYCVLLATSAASEL